MSALILLLCLSSFEQAYCQQKFAPGYVVLNSGDTLWGTLRDRKEGWQIKLYRKIRFKGKRGFTRKYGPEDIVAYQINGQEYASIWIRQWNEFLTEKFVSQAGVGKRHFVRVMQRGKLEYYHWEHIDFENQSLDFIPLFKRPGQAEMVRVTQGVFGLKKERLSAFFYDCPQLVANIRRGAYKIPLEVWEVYEQGGCH